MQFQWNLLPRNCHLPYLTSSGEEIRQESRFNPSAISPMGAQGIAQFMPATAAMRGLTNALEPLQALHESASSKGKKTDPANAPSRRLLAKQFPLPTLTMVTCKWVTGSTSSTIETVSPLQPVTQRIGATSKDRRLLAGGCS